MRTLRIADVSGSVNLSLWKEEASSQVQAGDIFRLRSAYTTIYKGCLGVNTGRNSELLKVGESVPGQGC